MKCVDLCCSTTLCEAVVFSWLWTCWPKTISCPTRIYPLGGKDSLVTLMAPFVVNSNQQQLHPKQTLTTTLNHYPRYWTLNSPPSSPPPPPPHSKSIKQVFCWCRIWEERRLRFLQLLVKNYPLKGYWSKAIDSNIKIVILLPLENPKTSLQKDFKLWWPWNLFVLNLNKSHWWLSLSTHLFSPGRPTWRCWKSASWCWRRSLTPRYRWLWKPAVQSHRVRQ